MRPLLFEKKLVSQELIDDVWQSMNIRTLNYAHAGLRKSGVTMVQTLAQLLETLTRMHRLGYYSYSMQQIAFQVLK